MLFLAMIIIFSNKPTYIEANSICENEPNIKYHISEKIICIPSDEIFKGSFE